MLFRLFLFISFLSIVPFAHAGMIDHPSVKLQTLDKSTARTVTLDAKVGSTIEYGSIFIKVQACRKSEPLEKPENAAFLQIWEVPLNAKKSEWLFSGWMFSSSPALSAMDHPVYDVWVLECSGKGKQSVETTAKDSADNKGGEESSGQDEINEDSSKPRIIIEEDNEVEPPLDNNDPLSDVITPIIEEEKIEDLNLNF